MHPFLLRQEFSTHAKNSGTKEAPFTLFLAPDLSPQVKLKIRKFRNKNRNLNCQLAHVVLMEAMEKDGAILPGGVASDQIRQLVWIIDGPISKALQSSAASAISRAGIMEDLCPAHQQGVQ
jgi:hypothetical protein